ncbi:protein lap4-like [Daphnia carinata]|uniref:protein lap4-like n=1 Tax=Daphnia carinata TaxID=120202 RepID=UPI00257BE77B|nr:protein lap4-like [Daphnia carinata]
MSRRLPRASSSQQRRRSYVELQEEEVHELRVERRKWNRQHGLGLTVAGGGGSFPYRGREEGIFVAKLVPGGAADEAGLKLDDEILSINGVYCSDLEHHQAVDLLRNSGGDLYVRVLRKVIRLVESAVPLAPNVAPLIRSRSSYQLNSARREENGRSRTPDPQMRRRSYSHRADDIYPPTPMEETGYLRPRTPPLRRMSTSHQVEPSSVTPYSSRALQHTTHLDSTGVHFHPYCFACNPSVVHLNPSNIPQLPLPSISSFPTEHIYATPDHANGYPSPTLSQRFNSSRPAATWVDDEPEDTNRFTVRLERDEVTGLGFIVSTRDGQAHSEGVYISGIIKDGVADRSGMLMVGDRILSINGLDVEKAHHKEVVTLLSRSKPYVQLELERDPSANYPEVFDSETEPEHFNATRRSTLRSSMSHHSEPWQTNYTQINHNPPPRAAMPLKSSLKASSRVSAPIATPVRHHPRYPSPSPSPPHPPRRSSSASMNFAMKSADPNDLKLHELQFPPPPTELGRFRESITKNTLTETVVTRVTTNQKGQRPVITEDVVIRKDMGSRLGLRIAGGKDSCSIPFGVDEPGIFISRVIPQGTAARSGRLRIGDRLLKINGNEVSDWTHHEVIRTLSQPSQQIILTVRHDPQPEGLDEFLIQRKDDEQFGIKIIGGVLEQDSYCGKKYDSGIFVSKVHRGGAIARDGRVKVGMRLLEVNGTNVIGVTRREAIEAFRKAGHVLRLMVCDGWSEDTKAVDSDDVTSNRSSVMSNSSWSDKAASSNFIRHQSIHGAKQPNGWPAHLNESNSARSTPTLSKKKHVGVKLPDLRGSKHFPKRPSFTESDDVKTTTIVMSKTTVDKPDKEVFDEC